MDPSQSPAPRASWLGHYLYACRGGLVLAWSTGMALLVDLLSEPAWFGFGLSFVWAMGVVGQVWPAHTLRVCSWCTVQARAPVGPAQLRPLDYYHRTQTPVALSGVRLAGLYLAGFLVGLWLPGMAGAWAMVAVGIVARQKIALQRLHDRFRPWCQGCSHGDDA